MRRWLAVNSLDMLLSFYIGITARYVQCEVLFAPDSHDYCAFGEGAINLSTLSGLLFQVREETPASVACEPRHPLVLAAAMMRNKEMNQPHRAATDCLIKGQVYVRITSLCFLPGSVNHSLQFPLSVSKQTVIGE